MTYRSMKIKYYKQKLSQTVSLSSSGDYCHVICENLTEELTEIRRKSATDDGEENVYYIHKKSSLFSDPDWTIFANIGEAGLCISNLIKLKKWYTLDSIQKQIPPHIQNWIRDEHYYDMINRCIVHIHDTLLITRRRNQKHFNRHFSSEVSALGIVCTYLSVPDIVKSIQEIVIDYSKLVPLDSRSTSFEMETTEDQLIKFGKKITLGAIIGTIGSIVLPNILEGILGNSSDTFIEGAPGTNISFKCTRH